MRTIEWSGLTWQVKEGLHGPGPNHFSSANDHVWIDSANHLHLRAASAGNIWYCAELRSQQPITYGHYHLELVSPIELDRAVVFGFFVYADDQHEIDIECSRWGTLPTNVQYALQPDWVRRFTLASDLRRSQLSMDWNARRVKFSITNSARILSAAVVRDGIPQLGRRPYHVHLNLWLHHRQHMLPLTRDVEVILANLRVRRTTSV